MLENSDLRDEKVFGEKLEGVKYTDRIGAYGIAFNDKGEVATIRTATGYFLPGGGIDGEECEKECLEREFIEEIGHRISVGKFIGKASKYHYSDTLKYYMHGIGYFYMVNLQEKITDAIEKDHELLWLEPKECIKALFLEHQAWAVVEALTYRK